MVIHRALIMAFIPFAVNSPDIVGSQIQKIFDEVVIGLANLLNLSSGLLPKAKDYSGIFTSYNLTVYFDLMRLICSCDIS
jgi:hypothetical protein